MNNEKLEDLYDYFFGQFGKISYPLRNAKYWVRHRTIDKYHIVKTALKPGYYDVDYRMLHAVMALVCVYVEDEQGGEAELERWAKELLSNPDPNAPELTEALEAQGKKDLNVLDIYRWWKVEYPQDCKDRDDLVHRLFSKPISFKKEENGLFTYEPRKFTEAEEKEYDYLSKLEEKIANDEQKYLHKAIDIRGGLWT